VLKGSLSNNHKGYVGSGRYPVQRCVYYFAFHFDVERRRLEFESKLGIKSFQPC